MKTFLSIGSGPGMGFATAEKFAENGYHVVLTARAPGNVQPLVDQLTSKGYSASIAVVDASKPVSVAQLIADTASQFGAIDVVHYNAAPPMLTLRSSKKPSGSSESMLVARIDAAATIHGVLPLMERRKTGTILLTGGGYGTYPSPEFIAMSIGKAGIRALVHGLFDNLKGRGIHIASVIVSTNVAAGSQAASEVGEEFFKLHEQPASEWTAEKIFTG